MYYLSLISGLVVGASGDWQQVTVGRWEKDRHTQTDKHTDRQDIVC